MKLFITMTFLVTVLAPLQAQNLSDLKTMERVKVFSTPAVVVGDWLGIRDSTAGVSENGQLRQIRVTQIDSLHIFRSRTQRVALASGLLLGTLVGVTFGSFVGADCGAPNCLGSQIFWGSAAFLLAGGVGALLGTMAGSGVGKWTPFYTEQRTPGVSPER